jgi:hypothetical protein
MIIKKELVLDAILEYVEQNKEDIDLFAIYGSYLRDDVKIHSNINFYYIPSKNSKKDLSVSFMLLNVGYYLEKMTNEDLIKISYVKNKDQYKLIDAKVLYAIDEMTRMTFENIRLNLYNFVDFNLLIKKEIELAKLAFFKKTLRSYHLFTHLLNALVYSKKSFLKRGVFNFEEELLALRVEVKYIDYLKDIYLSANDKIIKVIIEKIEEHTMKNIEMNQEDNIYDSFYEQLNNLYINLLTNDDLMTKLLYLDHIQYLIDDHIVERDLITRIYQTSDEDEIMNQQDELYAYLIDQSVEMNYFDSIEQLAEYLLTISKKIVA